MTMTIYTGESVGTIDGIILGGVSTSIGPPPQALTVDGGAQIATIDGFSADGNGVPLYAYVSNALPRVTLSFNNGFDGINNPGGNSVSATFVLAGGTTVTATANNLIPDPSASRSTGANGGQITWIKQYSDASDPFSDL